jgi:hypothetical protein
MQRKDGAPTPISERKRAAHSGHASNDREGFLDESPHLRAPQLCRVMTNLSQADPAHAHGAARSGGCSGTYLELRPPVEFSFL